MTPEQEQTVQILTHKSRLLKERYDRLKWKIQEDQRAMGELSCELTKIENDISRILCRTVV